MQLGYWLSSEEHGPNELVEFACRAEQAGFSFAVISDHYHPWTKRQGQSPFVWSVLGGIAQRTQTLRLGTGVTCPIMRLHPAIVAQAAATAANMLEGRFFQGVGTVERLNEHILGQHWPAPDVRLDMLEEAIGVLRALLTASDGPHSHHGRFFTVEEAQIFSRPSEPPPIFVAASGPAAAKLAGRVGDGLIAVVPDTELVQAFGNHKPKYGQVKVCWAPDEATARGTVREFWPTGGIPGSLNPELRTPAEFEQAATLVTDDQLAEKIVCGPDPARHMAAIRAYESAGFDHVSIHQVGPDQAGFFSFYAREILPQLR
jgi:G6PDH family F420-dependent oxidoreductase